MIGRAAAWGGGLAAWAALLALVLLPGCSAPARGNGEGGGVGPPHRIVSMNPCVDAILREVAALDQIAAISHYSQDSRATSVPLAWAQAYPAVGDAAEDVLNQRPDLVIAGPHIAPETLSALRHMGVPLLSTTVPATVAESKGQIREIAARIGKHERGEALVARIEAALAQLDAAQGARPAALIWQDSGLVPGPGTLAEEMLRRAGFRSASAEMKLQMWDMVSVEQILLNPPDIIMTGVAGMEADGMGRKGLGAPMLAKAQGRIMTADFPSRLLHCAGPTIIATAVQLKAIRARWDREKRG